MSSDTDDCGNACVAAWEANEAHQSHSAVHPYFHRGFVAGWHAAGPAARADSAVPSSHVHSSVPSDRGSGECVQAPDGSTEADELLRALDFDPEVYRTEGGALNLPKIKAALAHPQEYPRTAPRVTDEMVTRFLCWRLPDNFAPDAGISFKRVYNEKSPFGPSNHEPTGTNLLDAAQAKAMLKYVIEGGT